MKTLLTLATITALALTGCSDSTGPGDGDVSADARQQAVAKTNEVLQAERMMDTARTVEDLTGGFAVGLADETGGLDMELGEGFEIPNASVADLSASSMLVRSRRSHAKAVRQLVPTMARRAPGDLIAEFTETNLDGSVSSIRVYETDQATVVRIERDTTFPNGNLLLDSIEDEIIADLGSDWDDESDDVWLFLNSALNFKGGQVLAREIDLREDGGLQPNARVEIVSTFTPRPNHPLLVDIVSTLVVDVASLEDEADDRFVSIERITRFGGVAFEGGSPRVIESLVPEVPVAEGEEPCGGTLSRDTFFRQDRALKRWTDSANWTCANGGQLSRTITYADDTIDSIVIAEDAQGVVTLDADERDGTQVDANYDPAQRAFEITTVFPVGSDPVQASAQGSTNEDETEFTLAEQITYLDGFVERNQLNGSEDENGTTLAGSHEGRDESVEFELRSNADETRLEGWVENDREERIDFAAEELPDGSRLLDFTARDADVTVVGHLEADPNGCGTGTLEITEDAVTVTIEFDFCEGELDDDPILAEN